MRAILILPMENVPLDRKDCGMFGLDRIKTMSLQLNSWSTQLGVLILPWTVSASPSHCQNLAL